jgi:two-component system, cell cycle response regulator DivK
MADQGILIIDTNKDQIQKITSVLEAEGYACFSALSGEAGIDLAKKANPALIFLNAAISVGMRALEICKTIHEINELHHVPIIILTPRKVIITERDSNLYGIVDYLSYNFSAEELILKTKDFLSRSLAEEIPEEEISPDEQQTEHMPDVGQLEHTEVQYAAVQPDIPELQPSDADAIDQVAEATEEKVPDTVSREGEEIKFDSAGHEEKPAETELATSPPDSFIETERKSSRKPVFIVMIVTFVIVVTAGIFLFYDEISHLSFLHTSQPEIIRPSVPAEQQAVTLPPSHELQKPQPGEEGATPPVNDQPKPQPFEEKKPKATQEKQKTESAKEVKPILPATPFPKEKSIKKAIYSVQIGVFKDKANANSLAKKFESKGYHARVYTSKAKDQSPIHRVLIGKFENEKDAKKHADTIYARENNIPVMIYKE